MPRRSVVRLVVGVVAGVGVTVAVVVGAGTATSWRHAGRRVVVEPWGVQCLAPVPPVGCR